MSIGTPTLQISISRVLALAESQHGVVTRAQLLELGMSPAAVKHRVRRRRLFPVHRGVYAVGSPTLTRYGSWIAAVFACGPGAVLSYESATALWGIRDGESGHIEVTVPGSVARRPAGITVHRRDLQLSDLTRRAGIPVTTPICTILDLATRLPRGQLEAAISGADKLGLVDPERLRSMLEGLRHRRGVPALRRVLDRRTFTLTDSALERRFLQVARRAGFRGPRPRPG